MAVLNLVSSWFYRIEDVGGRKIVENGRNQEIMRNLGLTSYCLPSK